MKPRHIILLALILVLFLCIGCSSGGDDDDDSGEMTDDDDSRDDDPDDDDATDDDDDDDCDLLFPDLLICAHRGATLFAPENTIPAIEKAFELGAHVIEVDVRHTSDGEYVLMHDDTVDRTTNGSGDVAEMTLDEIQALEVNIRLYPWISETIRVPTFAQALETIEAYGGQAYVDMKTDQPEGAVQVMVDLGLEEICFVHSGSLLKLDMVRSVSMDVRIQPRSSSVEETLQLIDYFDPDPEHIAIEGESGFTPANVDLIKSINATVSMNSLGVRDIFALLGYYEAWLGMMEGGIDIIQTDFPGAFVDYWYSLCE